MPDPQPPATTVPANEDSSLLPAVVRELESFASPLTGAATSEWKRQHLIELLGWDLGAITGASFDELEEWLADCARAVEGMHELVTAPPESLEDIDRALATAGSAIDVVTELPPVLRGAKPTLPPPGLLASDLLTFLTTNYLKRRSEGAYRAAVLLTLITPDEEALASAPFPADGAPVRLARARPELHLDRVGRLLTDPIGLLEEAYFPDGLETTTHAEDAADRLFPRIVALLRGVGVEAVYGMKPGLGPDLGPTGNALASKMLTLAVPIGSGENQAVVTLTLGLAPEETGNLGLVVLPRGRLELSHPVGGWALALGLEGGAGGFAIGRAGLAIAPGTSPDVRFHGEAIKLPGPTGAAFIVGSPTGTRLELGAFKATTDASFGTGVDDVAVLAEASSAAFVVAPGEGDGFIQKVLPKDGLRTDFDLAIGWSRTRGVHFRGAAGLKATLPVHLKLGPLEVPTLTLALEAAEAIDLSVGATAKVQLGPISAVVERVGLEAGVTFPPEGGNLGPLNASLAFKPPDGVGLKISAGPVAGGGYLFFDPKQQQYAGVLQLDFHGIALKAVGLISTQKPVGFSMLIIISAEFTPIQIGLGFTLNGVGGLLGVNRTVAVEPLRAGLKTGALGSIMFPKDPVRNAPQIVSTVGSVFPPAEGRFVFGPMAMLGWGTPTLLTIELGLILELPAPVRLLILGRLRALLPNKDTAIVRLQMDLLGVIDFEKGTAAVDATLYDSRVAAFAVTGDMAMRASWGKDPGFALAVGGFNPRFQAPVDFPKLERVAIALATGNNPRLRLEAYLAITSNTVQIGARVDLYAEAAGFSISGSLGFDALVQLSPFRFDVDIAGAAALKRGPKVLMAVTLDLTLSGPSPWRARGLASFKVLFIEASIRFDLKVGSEGPPALPGPVNARDEISKALADRRNWTAQLPAAGRSIVSLRELPPSEEVLVHPLGELTVRQRTIPLDQTLTRVGSAPVAGPRRLSVERVTVGSTEPSHQPVDDLFAPAQFFDMSDDEKLARPSFEPMHSGFRVGGAGVRMGRPTPVQLRYEVRIVRNREEAPVAGGRLPMPAQTMDMLAAIGAAAEATTAAGTPPAATGGDGTPPSVAVDEPEYVVASTDDLTARSLDGRVARGRSYSDVTEALREHERENPGDRGRFQVVERRLAAAQ